MYVQIRTCKNESFLVFSTEVIWWIPSYSVGLNIFWVGSIWLLGRNPQEFSISSLFQATFVFPTLNTSAFKQQVVNLNSGSTMIIKQLNYFNSVIPCGHLEILCLKLKTVSVPLVVQWLRIHLSMQGTPVWSLVWEDPTGHGATESMHHNYRSLHSRAF